MRSVETLGIGSLGNAILYDTYFVCVEQGAGDLGIVYGKSPASQELGEVKTSFTFHSTNKTRVSFYTFGTGQSSLKVDDLRVVDELPNVKCPPVGYIKKGGRCIMICHPMCQGCNKPLDQAFCKSCKKKQVLDYANRLICLDVCPVGKQPVPNSKLCEDCPAGYFKNVINNILCRTCPGGTYQDKVGMASCIPCKTGHFSKEVMSIKVF